MSDRLTVRVCGADRQPIRDRFDLDLETHPQRVGVVTLRQHTGDVHVDGLFPVQGYRVSVQPNRHKPASVFARAGQTVELWCPVEPDLVEDVVWPETYPAGLTAIVSLESIVALPPYAHASLLNIYAVMAEADLWRFVTGVRECRRDRIFVTLDAAIRRQLDLARWEPVDGSLHEPTTGFTRIGSFKQRAVPCAGLQVTLFANADELVGDLDIDDHVGGRHGVDVVRHLVTRTATHPYDIHQLLTFHRGIDPGYRLVV